MHVHRFHQTHTFRHTPTNTLNCKYSLADTACCSFSDLPWVKSQTQSPLFLYIFVHPAVSGVFPVGRAGELKTRHASFHLEHSRWRDRNISHLRSNKCGRRPITRHELSSCARACTRSHTASLGIRCKCLLRPSEPRREDWKWWADSAAVRARTWFQI